MRKTLPAVLAAASLIVLVCVCAAPARAEAPKPFDRAELEKLISDLPGFMAFMKTQEQAIEDANDPDTWQALQASSLMTSYLRSKGWSPERFFYVVSHVSTGLAAVHLEDQAPEIQRQLSESRAEILSNPALSTEMKQQILSQMEQGAAGVSQLPQVGRDLPASELALIRANQERLTQLFDAL